MRLRTKYAILLVGVMLVLGAVVLVSGELFERQIFDREQQELDGTTSIAADQVDREIDDKLDVVLFYANRGDVDQIGETGSLLEQLVDNTEFRVAQVIADNGTVIDFRGQVDESTRQAAIGSDGSDVEGFQSGMNLRETVTRPNTTEWTISFAAPILSPDGVSAQGVLVASLFLNESSVFDPVEALETDRQTVSVRGENATGSTATLRGPAHEFEDTLESEATVARTGWELHIQRDQAVLTDQLQLLQFVQLGSLIVVFLSVVLLGVYETRTTLKNTNALLDGFGDLERGKYDSSLSIAGADEWRRIADGFNEMSSGLGERQRVMNVLNRVLRHNLQNDLTVIQSYAERMPTMDDEEDQREAADTIIAKSHGLVEHGQKARHLQEVIEQSSVEPSVLDVVQRAMPILSDIERQFPDASVTRDVPSVAWGRGVIGIEHGIENLLENAFLHGGPTAGVTVTIETVDDEVRMAVRDDGPGIPEHEREVLQNPEETSLQHGSGVGLWVAYWTARKSGGELRFGDQSEGGHVVLVLPAAEPPDPS